MSQHGDSKQEVRLDSTGWIVGQERGGILGQPWLFPSLKNLWFSFSLSRKGARSQQEEPWDFLIFLFIWNCIADAYYNYISNFVSEKLDGIVLLQLHTWGHMLPNWEGLKNTILPISCTLRSTAGEAGVVHTSSYKLSNWAVTDSRAGWWMNSRTRDKNGGCPDAQLCLRKASWFAEPRKWDFSFCSWINGKGACNMWPKGASCLQCPSLFQLHF